MSSAAPPAAGSTKAGSLWAYALEIYGRPGAEARFLELQDLHGQSVPFLIWSLWLAGEGRAADAATLAAGAAMATSWDAAAIAPLRQLRRDLQRSSAGSARRREGLRAAVQQLELKAERMLLEMLEDASPPPGGAALPATDALAAAAAAWAEPAPVARLRALAAAVA